MPTLQSFSGNFSKYLMLAIFTKIFFTEDVEMASLASPPGTKDILEDNEDSDCIILDSRGSQGDSKYRHKQSFIQGIYGKVQDKVALKKSD